MPRRSEESILADEARDLRSEEIVAASPAMKRILRLVDRIAPTESNILITGESGTGKEKVARLIHFQSHRSRGPFVAVNAGAIPETLIESELFGHARGAFTDAKEAKRGFFETADGGTLFLDEIAEMPAHMQVRLLRALQDREVRPVGSQTQIKVDVRVIAATNRDLRTAMAEGRFREDLYYRLNTFLLHVPALRERKEDIPYLTNYFLAQFARSMGKMVTGLSRRAWGLLLNYDYPGNVRELENAIERAVILSDEDVVHARDLPPEISDRGFLRLSAGEGEAAYPVELSLAEVEARHIRRTVKHMDGNLTKAARSLGISRSTLWRKMKRYGIDDVSR